jgi:hypothetical protein
VSWLIHDGLVRAIFIGREAAKRSESDALVETAIELLSAGLRPQP